ncbi:hypothetical protein, partial [Arcobacter sp. CECT 8985]|uniref:hypothetical protein n=1 Tax=Arcobacter sp. CECT 8985 TaxID=1935424 RepID=UPI0010287746
VLDNLLEWVINEERSNDSNIIRCLILVSILFIQEHYIFEFDEKLNPIIPKIFITDSFSISFVRTLEIHIKKPLSPLENKEPLVNISNLKKMLSSPEDIENVNKNKNLINKFWDYSINFNFNKNVSNKELDDINNFIKTGII